MKTIQEQIAVMQHFANGGAVESAHKNQNDWENSLIPTWNWASFGYRIKDVDHPYAELKAAAKDPTKQIKIMNGEWRDDACWVFDCPPDQYEIRSKPSKVKLLAWFTGSVLLWRIEGDVGTSYPAWKRVPAEDKEIEVEE